MRDFLAWQWTHKTSCGECRRNYTEDKRTPPCDAKGHCPINAVDLLPENDQALDLYNKIEALGADTVFRMADLTLTRLEAENMLEKLATIAGIIAKLKAQSKDAGT